VLRQTLARCWELKIENKWKEPFWRLAMNGFTAFSVHDADRAAGRLPKCPCFRVMGAGDRMHHFWNCPVAEALRTHLRVRAGLTRDLRREELWLATAPVGMHQCVWDVVCLCTAAGLEEGRRYLYAHRVSWGERRARDARAVIRTIAAFESGLQAFACLDAPPRGWEEVPTNHAFLRPVGGHVRYEGPAPEPAPD
jgi:hypothetical protein